MRKTTPLGKANSISQHGEGATCSGIILTQSLSLFFVGFGVSVTVGQSKLRAKRLRRVA